MSALNPNAISAISLPTVHSFKNLAGRKFGKLTVVSYLGSANKGQAMWLCRCECGNESNVRGDCLRRGGVQSCGCYLPQKKHGQAGTPTYISYRAMLSRCCNPKAQGYSRYGGRGIQVCERWMVSFENFLADMGQRPEGTTLDRVDPNGNYEPGNVRWLKASLQNRNKRNNTVYTINGVTACLTEHCERLGMDTGTVYSRIHQYGWTVERALTTPAKKGVKIR